MNRANRQISSLPRPRPAHPVSTSFSFLRNGNGDDPLDENKPPPEVIDLTDYPSDDVST